MIVVDVDVSVVEVLPLDESAVGEPAAEPEAEEPVVGELAAEELAVDGPVVEELAVDGSAEGYGYSRLPLHSMVRLQPTDVDETAHLHGLLDVA